MNIKAKGSVTVPRTPRGLMDLLGWAKSVNSAIQQLRDRTWTVPRSAGGVTSESSSPCSFGAILSYKDDSDETVRGIRGGMIYCGESNITVPNQELNLEADGEWLVWIEVDCIANRDDDNEIFLPGMESGTSPADNWDKVTYSDTAVYPDNENPSVSTGTGKVIIPIGRLKIDSGSATLQAVGCGNATINQCAGILSVTRS